MTKNELKESFAKAGYLYSELDMEDLLFLKKVRSGVYATVWEDWEMTQVVNVDTDEEDVLPTYTLDYVYVKEGKAEPGGCGVNYFTLEEATEAVK